MKITPTPADVFGLCAYLLLVNGGRIDRELLAEVGGALSTFDDEDLPDDGIVAPLPGGGPPPSAAAPIDEAPTPAPATPPPALTHVFGTLIDFAL
ncbi:MAG: hypothetical protein WEB04_06630 [Dehalococcoidia bacterium]